MTAPTSIRQKAIALVEQLPDDQLIQAVEFLETLSDKAASTPQESALLHIIQRQLPPDDHARLQYLRQQNEAGEITTAEHQELLAYVDRIEHHDAERAAALIQLAQLRQVDLKQLVKAFLPVSKQSNAL